MDYPLSFGIGQQGGFTGNPMPTQTYLDNTPTLGIFQKSGLSPAAALGLAQAAGGLFGSLGGAQVQAPNIQLQAPQAMLSQGVQSRPQMLAAALGRYQGG